MAYACAHEVPMWGYGTDGNNRLALTAAGLNDIWAGSDLGEALDGTDRLYAKRTLTETLEHDSNNGTGRWRNPHNGHSGAVTLLRTYFDDNGKSCLSCKTTLRANRQDEIREHTICEPSQDNVTFKSAAGEEIRGIFIAPPKIAPTPAPAVVMLHGCAGLSKNGRIPEREQAWIDILHRRGWAVLLPSSFASRGLGDLCEIPISQRPIHYWEQRPYDAKGALTYLQSRHDIDYERIALMGWSNGAQAVLEYVRNGSPVETTLEGNDFKTAVIFYPGCLGGTKYHKNFSARIPTLIQHGKSDD
ncbi:MAG: hypothetical protein V6Z86_07065 [Hyphomicrobiales bacterium]